MPHVLSKVELTQLINALGHQRVNLTANARIAATESGKAKIEANAQLDAKLRRWFEEAQRASR